MSFLVAFVFRWENVWLQRNSIVRNDEQRCKSHFGLKRFANAPNQSYPFYCWKHTCFRYVVKHWNEHTKTQRNIFIRTNKKKPRIEPYESVKQFVFVYKKKSWNSFYIQTLLHHKRWMQSTQKNDIFFWEKKKLLLQYLYHLGCVCLWTELIDCIGMTVAIRKSNGMQRNSQTAIALFALKNKTKILHAHD